MGNRDRFQGMLIIYSRRGEKADEVIKRLADRERERALIISSDREIMDHAERVGATVMSAEEFSLRLQLAGADDDLGEPEDDEPELERNPEKRPGAPGSEKTPTSAPASKKNITPSNHVITTPSSNSRHLS